LQVSAISSSRRAVKGNEADPVMLSFLRFLEKQMTEHPELIEPADRKQLRRIGKLVTDVETD
jgi:hypothetical protein